MMDVVFISSSEKKGIRRVEAVLDRYAKRIGKGTWATPITQEGLDVVYSTLKKIATRQVQVTCFKKTKGKFSPLWHVGRQPIYLEPDGAVPVHRSAKPPPQPPLWVRMASLLAKTAGYAHDLGKANMDFQKKLSSPIPLADPVRHEWVSLCLLKSLLEGKSWGEACEITKKQVKSTFDIHNGAFKKTYTPPSRIRQYTPAQNMGGAKENGLCSPLNALEFLVATHHRMPNGRNKREVGHIESDINSRAFYKDGLNPNTTSLNISLDFHPQSQKQLQKTVEKFLTSYQRLSKLWEDISSQFSFDEAHNFWMGVCLLARPCLILSDHNRSSLEQATKDKETSPRHAVFANTKTKPDRFKRDRFLNQHLDWHLSEVGDYSTQIVNDFYFFNPPGLSEESKQFINQPSSGHYAWQNDVVATLKDRKKGSKLLFNMAGTGQGKTRLNLKALCELSGEGNLRVATCLNLRSLTAQTLLSFKEELSLGNQVAGVIGDMTGIVLPEKSTAQIIDDDENIPEDSYLTMSFQDFQAPEWVKHVLQQKKHTQMKDILMSPVVVCTTDFLVAAGDLTKQATNAFAYLRISTSDIIIDEIDAYDPIALVSVLRMVTLSAMHGKNIVVSSATLSEECANAVYEAWVLGLTIRGSLLKVFQAEQELHEYFIFDHSLTPQSQQWGGEGEDETYTPFPDHYREYLNSMVENLKMAKIQTRVASLASIGDGVTHSKEKWNETLVLQLEKLHGFNHQQIQTNTINKNVSVGLIRVARIQDAIDISNWLFKCDHPNISFRLCSYHSALRKVHRFNIEKNLDHLLTRKGSEGGDPLSAKLFQLQTQEKIDQSHKNICYIVVATPVEEIGRDHDFDWAIIEPSSVQSIVQTAGRVNRHRKTPINRQEGHYNIAIMEYNLTCLSPSWHINGHIFKNPGFDNGDQSYSEKTKQKSLSGRCSMGELLCWDSDGFVHIDASLKFELKAGGEKKHLFAQLDDESLYSALKLPLLAFKADRLDTKNGRHYWMNGDFYATYCLRVHDESIQVTYRPPLPHYYEDETRSEMFVLEGYNAQKREPIRIQRNHINIIDMKWKEHSNTAWLVPKPEEIEELIHEMRVKTSEGIAIPTSLFSIEQLNEDIAIYEYYTHFGLKRLPKGKS